MAFFRYVERPGIIGIVGRVLGDAGVNIAGMQVERDRQGGEALSVLTVDTAIPAAVLTDIATAIDASDAKVVDLDGR
jgi:D-3-phosphoglycerate dehydrogenase / 2-oxoglutarate reductase